MNSYLCSPVAKKAFSCKRSISVAENSSSLNDTPFLDATASPICLIEDYEKSQGISLDATFERENSQPLLELGSEKNKYPSDIFNTIDDMPETPKSVEIIDLTTSKKALQNRSPLLPTQPLPCSAPMQRRSGSRYNGTLDSWINRFEPSPKPKPVNADKYAFWLNISPDVSPEKMSSLTKTNKEYKENVEITVDDFCLSHISEPLTDSIGIQPIPLSSNSGELRRLTSKTAACADENLSEFLRISPHISSRLNTNQISEKITNLQNSLSGSTSQVTSTQEETNEDELDIISSLSDQSSLPLTPSPPNTLKKPEILRQISLTTMLGRSKVTKCYALMESQHTRSLMRAISSPEFCRNHQKYVDSELISRFNDDGNVRRKKAERRLLHGFDCRCCADYYEALGLNQDERNKRIDQVSRHRDIEREPSTPEYYWEVGMPNREEQRRRGQIIESNSPIAVKTRYPEYKSKRRARRRLFI